MQRILRFAINVFDAFGLPCDLFLYASFWLSIVVDIGRQANKPYEYDYADSYLRSWTLDSVVDY